MKKIEFIKAIAEKTGITQAEVVKMLSASIEIITDNLKKGEDTNITGFGAFKISKRAARNGVNPRTKEAIKIPAMNSPVFRAGKTLKEAVR